MESRSFSILKLEVIVLKSDLKRKKKNSNVN